MIDYLLLIVNRQAKDCDGVQTSGNCTLRHYEKDGVNFSVLWEYNSSYGELSSMPARAAAGKDCRSGNL